MTSPLLQLHEVHTHIGAYHILQGVDFDVPKGRVTVLLGRNGAGKTTTLRTIMGLWKVSAGSIHFDDEPIGGMQRQCSTPEIAQLGVAYVPENMGIFSDLTVRENLLLAARRSRTIEQVDGYRLEWLFGHFPALKKFWLYPAGKLSGGQKQMLAIARAMIEPRRLLLIDEPSKGLAPAIVHNLVSALRDLKSSDTTVLLVEQNFEVARALGDKAVVMDNGAIVHQGPMAALAGNPVVQEKLLGLSLGGAH